MEGRDEEGNVGLFLYGAEEINTDLQKIAQAHYDKEKREWVWERIGLPELDQDEEQELKKNIARVFNFEDNQVTQTIIDDLEQAKEFDPQKSEVEAGMQYLRYTSAASTMIALYYSSGDSPQNRNQEMLNLIAKVRELARQNSHFNEEDWKIEGVDSY